MMNKIIGLCFGVSLMAISLGAYAEMTAPDVLIKNTTQEVLSIVKQDKEIRAGDKKKILALVDAKVLPYFDFERMTQEAAGKNWRATTADQKSRLVKEFRNLLVNTYANTFASYKDQTVEVKPVEMPKDADEVTVKTLIVKSGAEPIDVDYEMEKTANGWKAFDLTVDGVSLITTYRDTFQELVDQSGIDGLIKTLADKNVANTASH